MTVATRPFEPTARLAEKKDQRLTIYFTPTERALLEAEAGRRGTTVHNLVRIALAALMKLSK